MMQNDQSSLCSEFFQGRKLASNNHAYVVMEFLASPESIKDMIKATRSGQPALDGVIIKLEKFYSNLSAFPLVRTESKTNAQNRRYVGEMVRFIMEKANYEPLQDMKLSLGNEKKSFKKPLKNSQYFGVSVIYKKKAPKLFARILEFFKKKDNK